METAKEFEENQTTTLDTNRQNDVNNWTDQQLLDAGWTQDQIDQTKNKT